MTQDTFGSRLFAPARRFQNRLWARRARLGGRATPAARLPEPVGAAGDADRGARLADGVWEAAGRRIQLGGGPIWLAATPNPRLVADREGFGWVDDLAALGTRPARTLAQAWTLDWIRRYGRGAGPGWEPDLCGRRAMRWSAQAGFLTDGLDPRAAQTFWDALATQQRYLLRAWSQAAPGLPRLRALAGLVWTGAVLPHGGQSEAIGRLGALADETTGPDGELASRRPEDLAEALALLIWTARLLEDARQAATPTHLAAIVRLVPVLRPLRMGDGTLARFHGGGGYDAIALDKALAELRLEAQPRPRLPMGYARLAGGRLALVMDGAKPPAGAWAMGAHASTLAFELSAGRLPFVVNCGPGRVFGPREAQASRRTGAHSTVEVGGASSARFERGALVGGPSLVSVRQAQDATGMWLLATQDGYVESHGLLHERRLFVDARGAEVRGEEILSVVDARARAAHDRAAAGGRIAFAGRFHLHPEVEARFDPASETATLTLASGDVWEFRAGGGAVALEESVYHDPAAAAPRPTRQVVVRAEVVEYLGQVTWSFVRVHDASRSGAAARPR